MGPIAAGRKAVLRPRPPSEAESASCHTSSGPLTAGRPPRAGPRPGPTPPRRHPGGLEARPARPLAAALGGHCDQARRPGYRVPQTAGGDRHHHHHHRRQARVPLLRRARRVRARPDPRAHPGRSCRRASPRPPRRPPRRDDARQDRRGARDVRVSPVHHGRIYFARSAGLGQGLRIWSVRPQGGDARQVRPQGGDARQVRPQGGDARQVRLPAVGGCRRTEYLRSHPLPDGRLGLARECQVEDALKDHFDLVAVDVASDRIEPLAPLGLMQGCLGLKILELSIECVALGALVDGDSLHCAASLAAAGNAPTLWQRCASYQSEPTDVGTDGCVGCSPSGGHWSLRPVESSTRRCTSLPHPWHASIRWDSLA
jgi:hypothetical protein